MTHKPDRLLGQLDAICGRMNVALLLIVALLAYAVLVAQTARISLAMMDKMDPRVLCSIVQLTAGLHARALNRGATAIRLATTLRRILLTRHGRATPLLWPTFDTATLKNHRNTYD